MVYLWTSLADNVHEAILCLCDTGILYLSQLLVVALMVCVCVCEDGHGLAINDVLYLVAMFYCPFTPTCRSTTKFVSMRWSTPSLRFVGL